MTDKQDTSAEASGALDDLRAIGRLNLELLRQGAARLGDIQSIDPDPLNAAPAFGELSDFFQQMLDSIPRMGADEIANNVFIQINELGGFPVASREYTEQGELESESALRSARRIVSATN